MKGLGDLPAKRTIVLLYVGTSWNLAFTLEKPFTNGFYGKAGYSYGEAKNTVDPGSVAFGSWNNNQHSGNGNNPGLGFSSASPGHRVFGLVTYGRDYFKFGTTTATMFWETRTGGNTSYVFGGDLNLDGGTSNDLIYIPKDASEMNFSQYTASGTVFTVQAQQEAFESFIQSDNYLSKNRGKYAQRGAAFLPFVSRADFSLAQEVFVKAYGRKHRFQVRADVINFTNLLNKDWGIGQTFTSNQPLVISGSAVGPDGRPIYRMRNVGTSLISEAYQPTASIADVYRVQLGFRYIF